MTREIAREIGRLSEKINEMGRRIDALYSQLHQDNGANIDYIAMISDIDLPSNDDKTTVETEEEAN